MTGNRLSRRRLKKKVLEILASGDLSQAMDALSVLPAPQVINALFSFLLHADPGIKWSSVTAMGEVVARLAARDLEAARVIMRRLMWQLNDESGGVGWGCPETMGEIMACHRGLSEEFAPVLVSYVIRDGNFLEYEPLQEGALWGIARLAQARPNRLKGAVPHILPFLTSRVPQLRGLAARALGLLNATAALFPLGALTKDREALTIFVDREFRDCTVMELAKEALIMIGSQPGVHPRILL